MLNPTDKVAVTSSLELSKVTELNEKYFEGIDQKSAGFYTSRKIDEQKYRTTNMNMKKSDQIEKPKHKENKPAT